LLEHPTLESNNTCWWIVVEVFHWFYGFWIGLEHLLGGSGRFGCGVGWLRRSCFGVRRAFCAFCAFWVLSFLRRLQRLFQFLLLFGQRVAHIGIDGVEIFLGVID